MNSCNDMEMKSAEAYNRIRLHTVYEKMMESETDIEDGRVEDAGTALDGLRRKYGL